MSARLNLLGIPALAAGLLSVAAAGLLDSPPPELGGRPATIVYRLGPVYFQAGRIDTIVTCTNHDEGPVTVGIEIFGADDRLAGRLTSATLNIAGAVTFVTSAASSVIGQVIVDGLPPVDHGKARVSATSPNISCSAVHLVVQPDGTVQNRSVALVKKVARSSQP